MAGIEVAIKIPKRVYDYIRKYEHIANSDVSDIKDAIINGTPLPKGHGRLIDADRLVPDCEEQIVYFDGDEHNEYTAIGIYQIETAQTIIEADKEQE